MADTDVVVRPPTAPEQRRCETLIREAFWDVYRPGCIEHLIWRRAMAGHPDALPHLILVADRGGELVGCTMSTRAWVEAPDGLSRTPVVGVGPIGVVPGEQRRGIGSRLMEATMDRARRDGERVALLFGAPAFYGRFGFQEASRWGVTTAEGDNFPAFMAAELVPHGLRGVSGRLIESPLLEVDESAAGDADAAVEAPPVTRAEARP